MQIVEKANGKNSIHAIGYFFVEFGILVRQFDGHIIMISM